MNNMAEHPDWISLAQILNELGDTDNLGHAI